MATYRVQIPKVIWLSMKVEAADEQGAINEVYEQAGEKAPGLCGHCSGWGRDWSIDEDDWGSITDVAPQFEVTAELVEDGGE